LRQRTEAFGRLTLSFGTLGRVRLASVGLVVAGAPGRALGRLGQIEEQIKTLAKRLLFILRLGKRQQQGVAQDPPFGKADFGDGAHRVDAFGRR